MRKPEETGLIRSNEKLQDDLISLYRRIVVNSRISEDGIQQLVRWLRMNRNSPAQSVKQLLATVSRIVADRRVTRDEAEELLKTLEDAKALAELELRPSASPVVVKRPDEVVTSSIATAGDLSTHRWPADMTLHVKGQGDVSRLTERVEYGEQSIPEIARRHGPEVAAAVERHVAAREKEYLGTVVRETELAMLFRLKTGGDHWLPKRCVRFVAQNPFNKEIRIAISPSLALEIDRHVTPRNLLSFTTMQVAERFNVKVGTVRKWIRDGHLRADSVGNGGAVFEYQINEEELNRFAIHYTPKGRR